jgi:hypothetical protein
MLNITQLKIEKNLLLQSRVVLQMTANGFADHGIFAHENHGMVSQRATNLLQLLGSNIVCSNNETLGVFIKELLRKKQ